VHEEHEWKLAQVRRQTERFEQGRSPEWRVDDAPAQYIDQQLKAIVGLEIDVISVEGKAKLSQNRPVEDSTSVREHLESGSLTERNVAQRMDSDE
jgi:transcriptional regulator